MLTATKNFLLFLRQAGGGPAPVLRSIDGLWLFDDGSGQVLTDTSGNGNHGQLGATSGVDATDPTWVTEGLSFDGGDYITIPQDDSLNGAGDRTLLICWMQTVVDSETMFWDAVDSTGYRVRVNASAEIYWTGDNNHSRFISNGGFLTCSADNWHLGVFRQVSGGNKPLVSWDGVDYLGSNVASTISALNAATYIGARRNSSKFFTGTIGLAASWSTYLTDAELAQSIAWAQAVMATKGVGPDELVILGE